MNESFFINYVLLSRVGKGSFGEIFRCEEISTCKKRAVKVATSINNIKQLINEILIYKQIQGAIGFSNMHWYGKEGNATIMVMDLLGNNLETLFNQQKRNFTIKTVLLLADQMISRVEFLHKKGYIHHDIKPENFVFGNSIEDSNTLYLIDYGLSKRFINPHTGEHIKCQNNCFPSGTIRYLSINGHKGILQSRRDDMESLGYIFIYFLTGRLPWQGASGDTYSVRSNNVLKIKLENSIDDLCYGLPIEFLDYMNDVRSLQYNEEPHYSSYKLLFRNLLLRMNYFYDDIYDWMQASSPKPNQNLRNSIQVNMQIRHQNQNSNSNVISYIESNSKKQEKITESLIQHHKKAFQFRNCKPIIKNVTHSISQVPSLIKKPIIK